MKKMIFLLNLFLGFSTYAAGLGDLPVQESGRIKPFDTYARESLHLVYGKETYNKKSATDIVFSWLIVPDIWENEPIVLVRHAGLRDALGIAGTNLYFSPVELMSNTRLNPLIQDLRSKTDVKEKLNPFDQAVQTLENQLSIFHAIRSGMGLHILPPETGDAWIGIQSLESPWKEGFLQISQNFVKALSAEGKIQNKDLPDSERVQIKNELAEARVALNESVQSFIAQIEAKYGDYSHRNKIKAELIYNKAMPFRWAWVLYFLGLVFFTVVYSGGRATYEKAAWAFTGLAFLFHTFGFSLRIFIMERPPVSNMFETVVWVAWGTIVLATILYRVNHIRIAPLAATMVATLSLILCDVSSSVLDDSLSPLEPVLRDNFWLATHVVIIVSSYAAFFLAFFIGDIMLYYFLKDEKKYAKQIQDGTLAIYRAMQVGVVLIFVGIILGGIWADYSWGRFWGWDPKETWAFIAFMGYLIILHGRVAGWLKQFGLAAAAVLSFSLVIMAWYGVNFVLGAGLHTYGFGAGGVEYVSAFVAVHILYVAYVSTLRQSRRKSLKEPMN